MPARVFRRELRVSYFAPFFAMALLSGVVLWRIDAQISITQWVEHADDVLLLGKDAEVEFRRMRTAFRSCVLSPEPQYLTELRDARDNFESKLQETAISVTKDPQQARRWSLINKIYLPGKFEELIKDSREPPSAVLAQSDAYSRQLLDALHAFAAAEFEIRARRVSDQRSIDQAVIVLVPSLSILIAVMLSYWGWREIVHASQQFAAALGRAEESSRAKEKFIATISHELRNPLNAIILSCSSLQADQTLQEKARQRVRGIERAARIQAQLIEDLLDTARIESGRMRLDVQATDLSQVVKAAVDAMRLAAEAKSIDLVAIIDSRVNLIAGDPHRLQQVVWNLISNAVKFTPKGGKIQVRLERTISHVEIVVADSGQGIAPASLPRVFERFWRESDSDQSRPGTGLGLSIVKELVDLHGGTVLAHSDGIDKGSTFTVRLPPPVSMSPLLEPRSHLTVASSDDGDRR